VIENIHFLRSAAPGEVGWKAMCRAISDIGAMGGVPRHALVTVALPPDLPLAWLDGLYRGLTKAAKRFETSIVGGETSRSPGPVFINVSLTGEVDRARCVHRSGGRPGDALFVTGRLGGSSQGKHLTFSPRLKEAQWLVQYHRPSAMMDLSDGLGADLPRLAKASGCGFHLEEDRIPNSTGCSSDAALNDGEDYELLFAIGERRADALEAAWRKNFPKLRLSRIGSLTPIGKAPNPSSLRGFDHFRQTV
jgi:thiamine-monophosphate kinase